MNETYNNSLQQRHFFRHNTYKIVENGVEMKEATPLHTVKTFIRFEGISDTFDEVTITSKPLFWSMIVFWLLAIIVAINALVGGDVEKGAPLFWGGFGIVFTFFYLTSREKYLLFKAGQTLTGLAILKDKPNKIKFKQFIDNVQTKKAEYLKRTYLTGPVESNSADAIQKLVALKELGALTEEEFSKLKAEVVRKAEFMGGSAPSAN
jgi:hypothetical protein